LQRIEGIEMKKPTPRTLRDVIKKIGSMSRDPEIASALVEALSIIDDRLRYVEGDSDQRITFSAILAKKPTAGAVIHAAPSVFKLIEELCFTETFTRYSESGEEQVRSPIAGLRLSAVEEHGWHGRRWEIQN
jgi:hypothetical protein